MIQLGPRLMITGVNLSFQNHNMIGVGAHYNLNSDLLSSESVARRITLLVDLDAGSF